VNSYVDASGRVKRITAAESELEDLEAQSTQSKRVKKL